MLRILFIAILSFCFTHSHARAAEPVKTILIIEDAMGFAGPAMTFHLRSDGGWKFFRRLPVEERAMHDGKLSEKEIEGLMKDLASAGAFDAKSKEIQPRNPRAVDQQYYMVNKGGNDKKNAVYFKRDAATAKAVNAILEKLLPAKAQR
ncbi:MAG: hypothetical protein WD768_20425 [Phycisphaeraceae bacterium]